jgi:hypothetical protein
LKKNTDRNGAGLCIRKARSRAKNSVVRNAMDISFTIRRPPISSTFFTSHSRRMKP